jgi:hypothetical protein
MFFSSPLPAVFSRTRFVGVVEEQTKWVWFGVTTCRCDRHHSAKRSRDGPISGVSLPFAAP